MVKKGIRVDIERVDKIYKALDKTLRNLNVKVHGHELLLACYFLMRTCERAGEQKTVVKVERK